MGIKLMLYGITIKDAMMSNSGKVTDVNLPVVDCPKPTHGPMTALQKCLECDSCEELTPQFVNCNFASKQNIDAMNRQATKGNKTAPRGVPPGVFDPRPGQ